MNASTKPVLRLVQAGQTVSQISSWSRLPSGRQLDIVNPTPDAWLDSDLATRLARTYRWLGESMHDLPLSVAQHSLMVLALRKHLSDKELTVGEQLAELLHDSEEGLIGYDPPSPVKAILGDEFKKMCNRLIDTVWKRYGVPEWTPESHKEHKHCDLVVAASEAIHVIGWSEVEVRKKLRMTHPVLTEDPLVQWYDCDPWMPWPAKVAAGRFLAELQRLLELKAAGNE